MVCDLDAELGRPVPPGGTPPGVPEDDVVIGAAPALRGRPSPGVRPRPWRRVRKLFSPVHPIQAAYGAASRRLWGERDRA